MAHSDKPKHAAAGGHPKTPNSPGDLLAQGLQWHRQGNLDAAAASYERVLALLPGQPQASHLLGLVAHQRGEQERAAALIGAALAAAPRHPDYLCDLGVIRRALGQHTGALEVLARASAIRPGHLRTLGNLAAVQLELGQPQAAADTYRAAIASEPANAAMHGNLGNVLNMLGQREPALQSFRRALAIDPNQPDVHSNLGHALAGAGALDEAIAHYREALQLRPGAVGATFNLAVALGRQGRVADVTELFREALASSPEAAGAVHRFADLLAREGRTREAIAQLQLALEYWPDDPACLSMLLFMRNYLAEDDSGAMRPLAQHYGDVLAAAAGPALPHRNTVDPHRRLRLGLVSGDFWAHAVARFLLTVLPEIDRDQFELFAYSSSDRTDAVTTRLMAAVPNWRPAAHLAPDALATLIRQDAIDVLVDLSGHSTHHRLPVFARRPAPVAVTWLGYFATTGLKAIDYVLANRWVIPPEEEDQWVEKPWRMPETYLCFSPPLFDVAVGPPPVLANGYVTFGSFNNLNKLSDRTVATWAEVLKATQSSRLLLRSEALATGAVADLIRQRFAALGIGAERLILEGHLSDYAAHLETYDRIDIALDPFPYAGGTTSVEALWMGVPVLTLKGDRYVAHMGESIMHNLGAPDWIADGTEDYVAKATRFAADGAGLAELRASLRPRLVTSPLMDAPRFARNFEAAMRGMWEVWCAEQS